VVAAIEIARPELDLNSIMPMMIIASRSLVREGSNDLDLGNPGHH